MAFVDTSSDSGCDITRSVNIHIFNTLDWDIQNFAQFAEGGKEVTRKQSDLMARIGSLIDNKQGDLEEIRMIQFEYNKAVRKAHNQILKAKA